VKPDKLGEETPDVASFVDLFGEGHHIRLPMPQAEFLADPVFHFYENRNVDIPNEWLGLAWREARFREAATFELLRSIGAVGDFDLAYSTLTKLGQGLSLAQATSLYRRIRASALRLESKWRSQFIRAFPLAVDDLPEPVTEDAISLHILTLGDAEDLRQLHVALSTIPAVANVIHADGHRAFGLIREGGVNTIIMDPFSTCDIGDALFMIFRVRFEFPEIVFVLFIHPEELEKLEAELHSANAPGSWAKAGSLTGIEREFFRTEKSRLSHYFRLPKGAAPYGFLENLPDVVRQCQTWHRTHAEKAGVRNSYKYDVALSFAGEDRDYADEIASKLRGKGVRVFYDSYEQADLWGKDLFVHLHDVYSRKSLFCMILVSEAYLSKMWTVHERRAAQERALNERDNEYILPVRIDESELPGLSCTIGYINIRRGVDTICSLFLRKLIAVYRELP